MHYGDRELQLYHSNQKYDTDVPAKLEANGGSNKIEPNNRARRLKGKDIVFLVAK